MLKKIKTYRELSEVRGINYGKGVRGSSVNALNL
ncbi:hypothetical protein SAMN05444483_105189 [Salegentibacter echinorum]|uniref:Uncharacterized protein n=1 Tax=Salegentibacter echinorum TaxID=1073325 RepID=A0A1M5HKG7_SALEC|nr:hypothetical protein SAMN05444483_105189 [Salegentibacter echinorum]